MREIDASLTPPPPLSLHKAFADNPDVSWLEGRFTNWASVSLSSSEYAHAVLFVEKYCTLLRELVEALAQSENSTSGQG